MKKIVKSYSEDGVKYWFDCNKMQMYANQMKRDLQMRGKKMTKDTIMKEMADKLFVSYETIKSWMYGTNGPSDLEQVKQVADYFGVEYHHLLDKEEEEMATVSGFNGMANEVQTQYTKDRVREIYNALLDCIYAALNFYYTEEADYKSEHEEDKYEVDNRTTYQETDEACGKVCNLIKRHLLDIPENLYNQVEQYVRADILNVVECAMGFIPDDDESEGEFEEELEWSMNYVKEFRMRYVNDLRRIFSDFIVK